MKYDTAGNRIYEPIQNCGCELTGGCEKCQIGKWKVKFDNDLEERNKRLFSQPLGVSRWKEIGKKYGYWKYFESQVKKEMTPNKHIKEEEKWEEGETLQEAYKRGLSVG